MIPTAKIWPYKVLASLLYTQHSYIDHHEDGSMTIPTKKLADSLRTRTTLLRPHFELLYQLGILDRFSWHNHYCVVRVVPPRGWARVVQTPQHQSVGGQDVGPGQQEAVDTEAHTNAVSGKEV